jgi:hypothetical protein
MPVAITWTQTADARLLHLRALGHPWHTVASELRVGRNAAIERARRLGLQPITRIQPPPRAPAERIDRPALPPGHPLSWQVINAGTCLEGEPYPYPVFL